MDLVANVVMPSVDATPYWYQTAIVSQRALYALWRSPEYTWTRIFVHLFLVSYLSSVNLLLQLIFLQSLVISLTYLNFGVSVRDLQSRIFAVSSAIFAHVNPRMLTMV